MSDQAYCDEAKIFNQYEAAENSLTFKQQLQTCLQERFSRTAKLSKLGVSESAGMVQQQLEDLNHDLLFDILVCV